jgi:uncharacterized repeat protein (TIGR01451 family)/LPXTG-motif cell wall-anchored protein
MNLDSHAKPGRRVAAFATAVLAGAAGLAVTVGGSATPAHAIDGDVTGTVFNDVNFNGVRDGASGNIAAEPPVGGVGVTATDAGGATVGTTETEPDGTYLLNVSGAVSSDVRVTFTPPAGYDDGARGAASGSTVQFVKIPGGVANVGLTQVGQFNTDADPLVVVPIERTSAVLWDATTVYPGLPALEGFPYSQSGREGDPAAEATPAAPTVLAEQRDTGNTWGTATYGTTTAFSAAFMRNGAPLGAGGTGAIYATDVAQAVGGDPNATLWVTIPNAGVTGRSSDVFPSGYDFAFDDVALEKTYRVGLGDIDVSADQTKLYAVNLNDNDRQLYEVPLLPGANPGDAPLAGEPDPILLPLDLHGATQGCALDDVRPFGLGEHRGVLYVTLTCTAQSTQNAAHLRGYVYAMDGATRTFPGGPVIEVALNYDRGEAAAGGSTPAEWNPWTNTLNGFRPEPVLSTISFDLQGNASLSIRDRQADKSADDWAPGELLKFCVNADGDFVEESNGSCGGQQGSQPGVGYGPGEGLFYDSSFTLDAGFGHDHTFLGSALQIPGFTNVLATSMAPENPGNTSAGSDYTQGKYQTGLRTLALDDGGITNWAALQYVVAANLPHSPSFHKAAGIGDLSALLALAPIEIGNRVWIDTDGDGVQDAGEPPLGGVTVNLYADGGTQAIATAITDAQGTYSFSNRPGVAPDASAHKWGLAITASTDYDVRVDNTADFTTGVLAGYVPTGTTNVPNSTDVDSNGVATVVATPGGPVTVSVDNGAATPGVGTADHTFDFGFVLPEYDLMITKSLVSSAPYSPGSAVAYSLVVRNNGPAVARSGLTVTDRLPAGLSFATPAASGPSWTCAPPAPADTVTCTWNGPDLAAGDTTTAITVNATVDAGAADGAVFVNVAVVRPSPQQPNPETIPVGTTNDGFENGSNVPTADHPSNNDDSKSISVTVTPPTTTTPPTTAPDTTAPPTTTPNTVLPPDSVPQPEVQPPVPPAPSVTPGELPVTGGNTNGLLYVALALVLVGGLGYVFARRPRRRA